MKVNASNTYIAPSFTAGSDGARWIQSQRQADAQAVAAGETRIPMPTKDLEAIYTRGSFKGDAATRAEYSLEVIQKELAKFDGQLREDRPDLAGKDWDVTVVDGKLAVTGSLDASDKAWLESSLNDNRAMVAAAGVYVEAAVMYLQTTEENPPFLMMNGWGGRVEHNFPDVAKSLEGRLGFRENIREVVNIHNHGRSDEDKQASVVGYGAGHYSFEMLSAKL